MNEQKKYNMEIKEAIKQSEKKKLSKNILQKKNCFLKKNLRNGRGFLNFGSTSNQTKKQSCLFLFFYKSYNDN